MQDKKVEKLLRIQLIEPSYSFFYLSGSLCIYLNSILFLIGFISPYWLKSNVIDQSSEFVNMGLFTVCFVNYKNLQATGDKYFDGCLWLQSNELFQLRRWLLPNWLILIQVLESFCICLIVTILISILIGLLHTAELSRNKLRRKFYFIFYITILLVSLDLLIITCLFLFGINSFFHEWTPESKLIENVFIYWSFWIQCISLVSSIFASIY